MKINTSNKTTPFAFISEFSCFSQENEMLFSMHTGFRINNIESIQKNLFQVDLTFTNDDDDLDLRVLTDRIREVIPDDSDGWYRLAELLFRIGKFDKSQQGQFQEALTHFVKSLKIFQNILDENHPSFDKIFNHIGVLYRKMRNYSQALLFYKKSLRIKQKTYMNIGALYRPMEDHENALFHLI